MSSVHVAKTSTYIKIFAALLVLTGVTVWVAFIDLGVLNDVVAMGIAITKALLVILFFMHVKGSTRMTKLTVAAGFVWLALFFLLLMPDYLARYGGVLETIPVPGK